MGLRVDISKIINAKVVPFEADENEYGIDWDLGNGWSGAVEYEFR